MAQAYQPASAVFGQNAGRPARQMQWSVSVQREVMRDVVVEASYVGNRGAWWRNGNLAPYNVLTLDKLESYGGLHRADLEDQRRDRRHG